jgi:cell division septum initiation protein DivIVA
MDTSLETDVPPLSELVKLRRQVRELQQALAHATQDRSSPQTSTLAASLENTKHI